MTTTLITGANKGLGFETARRLIAAGHTVYLGSRDPERGRAAAGQIGARMVRIDVTDDASVAAAAQAVGADGGLDVLVNNAGIEARKPDNSVAGPAELTADMMRTVFETNVFGVVRVTHAFLPLLQRSAAPVVVNVSSGLGSMARLSTPDTPGYAYPGVAYPASKVAVNAITVQFAKGFPGMRINAVEPGFTATDLNGHAGTQSVEEGAEIIVRMAQVGPDGPTGGYFDVHGPLPWLSACPWLSAWTARRRQARTAVHVISWMRAEEVTGWQTSQGCCPAAAGTSPTGRFPRRAGTHASLPLRPGIGARPHRMMTPSGG